MRTLVLNSLADSERGLRRPRAVQKNDRCSLSDGFCDDLLRHPLNAAAFVPKVYP